MQSQRTKHPWVAMWCQGYMLRGGCALLKRAHAPPQPPLPVSLPDGCTSEHVALCNKCALQHPAAQFPPVIMCLASNIHNM